MQDPNFVRQAFSKIADRYVITNHVLSLGTDILWRKRVGQIVAEWNPKTILDVATGTGDLALEMQRVCADADLIASDFCPEMLAHAVQRGVKNTKVVDAMDMPFGGDSTELLTVAFGLRNMSSYPAALSEMYRVIKPGGHLLVLDFSVPEGMLKRPYEIYLNKVLPKVAGWMTGEEAAYSYLAGSISQFPSGRAMCKMIEKQGFIEAHCESLSGGIASIYTATKP